MIYESNYYPQIMPQKYEINSNNYGKYHKKSQYTVKTTHQSVFSVILCGEKDSSASCSRRAIVKGRWM